MTRTMNLSTVEHALEAAIRLENSVTISIKKIISVCSGEPTSFDQETVAKPMEIEMKMDVNDYQVSS